MRIYLSKTAGFCMGVSRAVSKALELSRHGKKIYTYGPLIHNPQVIDDLKKKDIKVRNSLKKIKGATLIIRTHGVSPSEKEVIRKSGANILDLTCPRVARVEGIISRYAKKGYAIVIIGDANHPEVKALMGYADGRGHVVNKDRDIGMLPRQGNVCVVSQTTMDEKVFDQLASKLKIRYRDLIVFNTICDSTSKRQDEVRDLCKKVEAMIIIGGKNSANTRRLAEISRRSGVKAFHVETEKEIMPSRIKHFKSIGITAGASTPDWIIMRVVQKLQGMGAR